MESIENAVRQLYESNDRKTQKQAELWLLEQQKSQNGWNLSFQLLESQNVNSRFYGALTLQTKIINDWESLKPQEIQFLYTQIIAAFSRNVGSPLYVLKKIAVLMSVYMIKAPDDILVDFIPNLFTFQPSPKLDDALLVVLTVIAEDIKNVNVQSSRRIKLDETLLKSLPMLIQFIQTHIRSTLTTTVQMCLECIVAWVAFGVPTEAIETFTDIVISTITINQPDVFEQAVEVMTNLVGLFGTKNFRIHICRTLFNLVTEGYFYQRFHACVEEQDDDLGKTIARLLVEIGETFSHFIMEQFVDPRVTTFLQMMMTLTAFPGLYGVEQCVSEYPLTFWSFLQETWADEVSAGHHFETQVKGVCLHLAEVLIDKCAFPSMDVWDALPRDQQDTYVSYRREVGDIFISCFYVLRQDLLKKLYEMTVACVQGQYGPLSDSWHKLDAVLFAFKAVGEAITDYNDPYLEQYFQFILDENTITWTSPIRPLQKCIIQLFSSYAQLFNHRPELVPRVLKFIIGTMQQPPLEFLAAACLKTVCEVCKTHVAVSLNDLLHLWSQIARSLQPHSKHEFIRALSEVLQTLPPNEMSQNLMLLVGGVIEDMKQCFAQNVNDPISARRNLVDQLGILNSCCQGLQSSSDQDEFVSKGLTMDFGKLSVVGNEVYLGMLTVEERSRQSFVSGVVWDMMQFVIAKYISDEEVLELAMQFLVLNIKSSIPVFTPNPANVCLLLAEAFEVSRNNSIINTCSLLLSSLDLKVHGNIMSDLLLRIPSTLQIHYAYKIEYIEDNGDLIAAYIDLLLKQLKEAPMMFMVYTDEHYQVICSILVQSLQVQQRWVLKSCVGMLLKSCAFAQDVERGEVVNRIMNVIAPDVFSTLLQGFAGKQPPSQLALLSELLMELVFAYPVQSNEILRLLLEQENFPSPKITLDEKRAFLKKIHSTRQSRIFNEHVKHFSLQCKGLLNSSFSNVY